MIGAAIFLIVVLAVLYIVYLAAHKMVKDATVLIAVDAILAIAGLFTLYKFVMVFIA